MQISNNGNGVGKCGEWLRYDFSKAELEDFSKELARHTLERSRLEQQKKEVDAQLKATIEAETTQIAVLAGNVNTGHMQRMIDCAVLWHNPRNGRATIVRIDSGEIVRERAMTYEELQDRLPFNDPEPPVTTPPVVQEEEPKRRPVIALLENEEPKRRRVEALIEDGEIHDAEFTDIDGNVASE